MELLHTIYEPAGDGPHPTILALHGWGANGMDLLGVAPYLAGGRFLVLCPQGSVEVPLGPMVGYGWFPITMGAPPDPVAFTKGLDEARRFLDAAVRRYPVDRNKLVVLGFSQGGVIAYALALAEPERFAGLVALSSWLPAALTQTASPHTRERLSVLIHHGTRDDLIEIARGRESVETLRRLQVPVTYREFDMGHEISPDSLADLSDWLENKVLSPILVVR
ncbi:MAG TPA: alpha/beta fold hydrolase [Candidatus Acidoferrales bacterium]|nr:alpha/beta fold hydrolase [Candidatus Acidoferrales bacterium]